MKVKKGQTGCHQHAGEEEKEGVKRNLQRLPDSQSVILSTGTQKLRLKS